MVIIFNIGNKGAYQPSGRDVRTVPPTEDYIKQVKKFSDETIQYKTLIQKYQLCTGEAGYLKGRINHGTLDTTLQHKMLEAIQQAITMLNILKSQAQFGTLVFIDHVLNHDPTSIPDLHQIMYGTKKQYWRAVLNFLRNGKRVFQNGNLPTKSKIPIVRKFVEFVASQTCPALELIKPYMSATLDLVGPINLLLRFWILNSHRK
jgi:hypothetical protein